MPETTCPDYKGVLRRRTLDARQEAEAAYLLKENGWIVRQSRSRRTVVWLAAAALWPGALFAAIAALAGANWSLTWLVTSCLAAFIYFFPIFLPERMARFGASQLMTEAEQQRLQELPPRHPFKSM